MYAPHILPQGCRNSDDGSSWQEPIWPFLVRRYRVNIVQNAVSYKTRVSTDFWFGVFQGYCKEWLGFSFDFVSDSAEELASLLEGYYADIRKKGSMEYKRSSYGAARSAIQCHLGSGQRRINIFNNQAALTRFWMAYSQPKTLPGMSQQSNRKL